MREGVTKCYSLWEDWLQTPNNTAFNNFYSSPLLSLGPVNPNSNVAYNVPIANITEKYSDQGNVDIYLDNVFQQTVNCTNSTRLVQQTIFSYTWATSGTHTIKIVKSSGTHMILDAFKVIN